jgi:hypothetical protein
MNSESARLVMRTKTLRFGLITLVSVVGLTIFLFPRTKPATVVDAASGLPISHRINFVTLSPAFECLGFYSLHVWPNLSTYKSTAPSGRVLVVGPQRDNAGFFTVYYSTPPLGPRSPVEGTPVSEGFDPQGSFAWSWWLVVALVPSVVIGLLVAYLVTRVRVHL